MDAYAVRTIVCLCHCLVQELGGCSRRTDQLVLWLFCSTIKCTIQISWYLKRILDLLLRAIEVIWPSTVCTGIHLRQEKMQRHQDPADECVASWVGNSVISLPIGVGRSESIASPPNGANVIKTQFCSLFSLKKLGAGSWGEAQPGNLRRSFTSGCLALRVSVLLKTATNCVAGQPRVLRLQLEDRLELQDPVMLTRPDLPFTHNRPLARSRDQPWSRRCRPRNQTQRLQRTTTEQKFKHSTRWYMIVGHSVTLW